MDLRKNISLKGKAEGKKSWIDHKAAHVTDAGDSQYATNQSALNIFYQPYIQVHHRRNMFLCRRLHCSSKLTPISRPIICHTMATVRAKLPHEDRTVSEPRQDDIHAVVLSKIERVNSNIKLYRLTIQDKKKGVKVGHFISQIKTSSHCLKLYWVFRAP